MAVYPVTTLTEFQNAVRYETDTENDPHISDAELVTFINRSATEVYDILVSKFGDNYYTKTGSFATDSSSSMYPLASDFYKLQGVDLLLGGATGSTPYWTKINSFVLSDRNRYQVPAYQTPFGMAAIRYRLMGPSVTTTASNTLMLIPQPAGGQTIRYWYTPRMTVMASGSDTFDGISGWEEFVIVDASIKVMQKQERDASLLIGRRMALEKRIEAMAENRDAGAPQTVSDTTQEGPWGAWPGFGGSTGGPFF